MSQDLYNILIGVSSAAGGWILKVLWESVRSLQGDMKEIEREIHTKYVTKDDYRADIQELKDMCKAIFERLERKADKERG
jgi:hypothetical protein